MKQYPSIENSSKAPREKCHIFVKYDGSNLRFEWSKKRGWYKFGTRTQMFGESNATFGISIPLFLTKYGDDFVKSFSHKDFRGVDSFVVFMEFFGSKSIAGWHDADHVADPKDVVPFDVIPHKKGFLAPNEFLDHFGHLDVAELIGTGSLNESLIKSVRDGNFEEVDFRSKRSIVTSVPEGVICKGGSRHDLWMCKIKSNAYFDEIKKRFPANWNDYSE